MDWFRPKRLNPLQRLLVTRWFVWWVLVNVVVLNGIDLVEIARALVANPWAPVEGADDIAIRLVVGGVFLELRGKFVQHLLGHAASAELGQSYFSEACEAYGGYWTVAGLFVELTDSTRKALAHLTEVVTPIASVLVLIIAVMSMHVLYELMRAVWRGPPKTVATS